IIFIILSQVFSSILCLFSLSFDPSLSKQFKEAKTSVIKLSILEQLQDITKLASLGTNISHKSNTEKPKKSERKIFTSIITSSLRLDNLELNPLNTLDSEQIYRGNGALGFLIFNTFWILCFLKLFHIKKLKHLFILARSTIDSIISFIGNFIPPFAFWQPGVFYWLIEFSRRGRFTCPLLHLG
ncbi:MAG: hypothetical protein JW871_03545, partial [Endomicrobiales bacterium]|nr:hypothetical protein [Endomicrobiales bacterium]